jgi:hypothetical protein
MMLSASIFFFTVQWAMHDVFTQQVDDLLPPIRYLHYIRRQLLSFDPSSPAAQHRYEHGL